MNVVGVVEYIQQLLQQFIFTPTKRDALFLSKKIKSKIFLNLNLQNFNATLNLKMKISQNNAAFKCNLWH